MVKLLRCARGLYGSRRSSGSGWWRRAAFCFLNNSFTAQSCSIHTTASYCTGGSAFTSDDDGKWCSWNYNKQFFVSSSIILLFDDRQWANCPKNDFLWTLMSESCHAQLRKVLPLLLLLLSSPSPGIPLKWYFIVLAVVRTPRTLTWLMLPQCWIMAIIGCQFMWNTTGILLK